MPKKFTTDSPSFDEINALRKPRVETATIPLDGDLLDEIEAVEQELRAAERADARNDAMGGATAPAVKERLDALYEQAADASAEFTFEALPRKTYRKLISLHPSKEKNVRWDEETFAPALLAACCTSPQLTSIPRDEFVARIDGATSADDLTPFMGPALTLWNDWSQSQTGVLSGAAWLANEGQEKVPTGARSSRKAAGSEQTSTSAAPEE